jgi:hypothetical protein
MDNAMNEELKEKVIATIIVILLLSFIIFMVISLGKDINEITEIREEKREMIGQTIVLEKDTLVIVNCYINVWGNTSYTLSNGVKVSEELINKIK